jgi:hypothetical protein
MPLRAPKNIKDQADWDRWARNVPIEPDAGSTGSEQIKDGAVSTPKIADLAVTEPKIANEAVSNDKLRLSNALSVIGRATSTNGAPADISAPATNTFLARRGSQLTFDSFVESDIPPELARSTDVATDIAAAIAVHEGAPDPHLQYLRTDDAAAQYQPLAAVLTMLHTGTGSPETVVTATVGHLYLRSDGGAGTTLYVKESGAGNTGWVAK